MQWKVMKYALDAALLEMVNQCLAVSQRRQNQVVIMVGLLAVTWYRRQQDPVIYSPSLQALVVELPDALPLALDFVSCF